LLIYYPLKNFAKRAIMKRPILAYGHSILKQPCEAITVTFPGLTQAIADMWETMYNANGCGLAAPQIGLPIRLFIVDSKTTFDRMETADRVAYFEQHDQGIRETFINAKIIVYSANFWEDEEGCLSIPNLLQQVKRPWSITITYLNANFEKQIKTFSGTTARMIQHEYDHTEGILYLDHLSPLTRKLMQAKLKKIGKGNIKPTYPMRFK
jgi:peptide deformylase